MNEFVGIPFAALDRLGAVSILLVIAWMVITNKLVWHTTVKKVEADRDKWQNIAITALTGPAQAGVRAAEVAVGVVSAIPDPAAPTTSGVTDARKV